MEDRGDAIAERLSVAVDECDIDRKINAGAGHHLPFKGVAVQIDDPRQHQKITGIQPK